MGLRYCLACLSFLGYAGSVVAQGYPNKPVRVLVPTPAGSTPDTIARLVTPGMSALFGHQFIVDNRSGSAGMLGTELAANATPDGHTLLLGTAGTLTMMRHVQKDVPYQTLKDFEPIGLVSSGAYLFVAHPSVPVTTVAKLIALAKAEPGMLSYGSEGNGSTNHIAVELFKSMAGIDIRHIPYKSAPEAATSLLAGQVNLSMLTITQLLPHLRTQRLRVLAVASAKRSPHLPDIPTIDESGLKGYEASAWIGLLAPARTPRWIVVQLSEGLQKALRAPRTRAQFRRQGADVASGERAEFAALLRREIELYGKLANIFHIKLE